jgi:hypothetical protein
MVMEVAVIVRAVEAMDTKAQAKDLGRQLIPSH